MVKARAATIKAFNVVENERVVELHRSSGHEFKGLRAVDRFSGLFTTRD